ncbi:hypothetical protein [Listeria valentina]|uniref:hypothetical protein n=1 Tax=Listeria valentina TaxID=2705293 RepID=UPI001AD92C2C|nr:hypothetical protein [Listeria valentina]
MMEETKNIEKLYSFYVLMLSKMGNKKINLSKFKTEDNIDYDLKEDVFDNIEENLKQLVKASKELQEIDLSKDFTEINHSQLFHKNIVELMGVLRRLSIAFEDLADFNELFIQSLPDPAESDF